MIDGLIATNPFSANTNGTAASPLVEEFAKVESIGSASVYLAGKRNQWPVKERNKPKMFIKIGNSNEYFPFTEWISLYALGLFLLLNYMHSTLSTIS